MTTELLTNTTDKPKSIFVTVLAWIFIVLGGFFTLIGILQNIMIYFFFPKKEMERAIEQSANAPEIPVFFEFMFNHFDLFFLFFLLVSLTSFISAIALLKRKNWARIIFIIIMSLGILWNIFGLVMQFTLFEFFPQGDHVSPEFESMQSIIQIASVIMVVVLSSLFGFVIKKLCSKSIREEFV